MPYGAGTPSAPSFVAATKPASGFAIPEPSGGTPPSVGAVSATGSPAPEAPPQASGFAVPTYGVAGGTAPGAVSEQDLHYDGGVSAVAAPASPPAATPSPQLTTAVNQAAGATQMPAAPGPAGSVSQRPSQYGGVSTENKAGIIKDGAGRLLWQCSSCGGTNDIEAMTCSVCGSSMFAEYIKETESGKRPAATPGQAAAWGAIPGGGQWAAGHKGDAIGRGLLVLWLVACAILLNDKSILWVRLIFAAAALATWLISAMDARVQAGAKGIQVLTVKRMLLVLVLSVALLLALSFVLAGKVRELDQKNPRGPAPQTLVPSGGDPGGGDSGGQSGDGAPT
ncbi:MAG: hypothetical protein DCC49_00950 [Acidobacteria bacterium]|nr:MAG: hypothetical protein DCC49_00950 [Acidobacteriota bacterium]